MIGGEGRWNVGLIKRIFTKKDAEIILQIPISKLEAKDKLTWMRSANGLYSVHSAYNMIAQQKGQLGQQPESSYSREQEKSIWKRM